MSRTDELEQGGARQVSGGGNNAPFVKWGESYGFVEGVISSMWETKYGDAATMVVEDVKNVQASPGRDEPNVKVEGGQTVNVGLQYSALSGVTDEFVGHRVHIAFEGWEKSKQGNRYRVFKVFDLGAVEGMSAEPEEGSEESEADAPSGVGAGPGLQDDVPPPGDDELPF